MVHALDLNEDSLKATEEEIRATGGQAQTQVSDVTKQAAVKAIFEAIGPIDILVNSAGISHIGTCITTSEVDFDRVFLVNVKGVYNCLHAVLPIMKQKGGGVIVNLASMAANISCQFT